MMSVTCVDVVGAKLFRTPVFGAIDVVMIAQLIAISFAAAMTLIAGRHVQVEFFVVMLPKRLQVMIDCLVHFLGFALFVLIVWRLLVYGYDMQEGGEETATARIILCPFVYGAAIASIPVCLVLMLEFLQSVMKVLQK